MRAWRLGRPDQSVHYNLELVGIVGTRPAARALYEDVDLPLDQAANKHLPDVARHDGVVGPVVPRGRLLPLPAEPDLRPLLELVHPLGLLGPALGLRRGLLVEPLLLGLVVCLPLGLPGPPVLGVEAVPRPDQGGPRLPPLQALVVAVVHPAQVHGLHRVRQEHVHQVIATLRILQTHVRVNSGHQEQCHNRMSTGSNRIAKGHRPGRVGEVGVGAGVEQLADGRLVPIGGDTVIGRLDVGHDLGVRVLLVPRLLPHRHLHLQVLSAVRGVLRRYVAGRLLLARRRASGGRRAGLGLGLGLGGAHGLCFGTRLGTHLGLGGSTALYGLVDARLCALVVVLASYRLRRCLRFLRRGPSCFIFATLLDLLCAIPQLLD
mmetsp:Transcript_93349/g.264262  ORF Transcript_93349/g.264262 Transcript_93349/m.264262 type:complete len:376 (+) Transcript_93349:88-1215(+)